MIGFVLLTDGKGGYGCPFGVEKSSFPSCIEKRGDDQQITACCWRPRPPHSLFLFSISNSHSGIVSRVWKCNVDGFNSVRFLIGVAIAIDIVTISNDLIFCSDHDIDLGSSRVRYSTSTIVVSQVCVVG